MLAFSLFLFAILMIPEVIAHAYTLPCMPPDNYDQRGRYPEGQVKSVCYYSSETRSQRKMCVYTPPGYTTSKRYPVIYAIHGIDNWPESIFADWCVNASVVADNLLGEGKIEPVIIVAIDNNNINSHNELLNVVIPYVESNYAVIADADHRGIYGYSMGGGVAFAEGIGNLDVFHHVCPSSALPINHPSDQDMFPYGGAEAKQKLKTLMLSCGTADWCGFYPSNLATHNYCQANGIPHAWLSVEGGNHDGGVWSPAMWNFLQLAFPANGVTPEIADNAPGANLPGETKTLPDGWYTIKNLNAKKYLQVKDAKGQSGQNVEIATGNGSESQKWYLKNLGNGFITLTSALGEFMLDVNGASSENDANIQIYNGHSGNAQQFLLKTTSKSNTYVIATKASNTTKVVDAARASKEDGTNVCQYAYNGNANQQWTFEPVSTSVVGYLKDGWYCIKNVNAEKYLQVQDGKAEAGQNVEIASFSGNDSQKWYLKNVGDGYVTLTSALGSFMLDIASGSDANHANVQIYHGYSGTAQQFQVKLADNKESYIMATKASGTTKVVDAERALKNDGTNVCQYEYNGNANQQWIFEAVQ